MIADAYNFLDDIGEFPLDGSRLTRFRINVEAGDVTKALTLDTWQVAHLCKLTVGRDFVKGSKGIARAVRECGEFLSDLAGDIGVDFGMRANMEMGMSEWERQQLTIANMAGGFKEGLDIPITIKAGFWSSKDGQSKNERETREAFVEETVSRISELSMGRRSSPKKMDMPDGACIALDYKKEGQIMAYLTLKEMEELAERWPSINEMRHHRIGAALAKVGVMSDDGESISNKGWSLNPDLYGENIKPFPLITMGSVSSEEAGRKMLAQLTGKREAELINVRDTDASQMEGMELRKVWQALWEAKLLKKESHESGQKRNKRKI